MSKLNTTGDLRTFLADAVIEIKNGLITPDAAKSFADLASKINDSFNAEVRAARVIMDMGGDPKPFGELQIGK